MDIRDFLTKIDAIQSKEQMKEDVKKIHLNEASQVMLYGDTPEDMNAIAQIFKNAGVSPPAPVEGPTPEAEPEAEVIMACQQAMALAMTQAISTMSLDGDERLTNPFPAIFEIISTYFDSIPYTDKCSKLLEDLLALYS